ncbi:MAG: hypothetical protein E7338_03755 [Clostridiales bacterium]|nr:hypothetical protein [Clostridiales bacterium]
MDAKRVTLFSGHYGSGKTNVALNYAIYLKEKGEDVEIYDMDIVNPYFRTLDGKDMLDKHGIPLVVSDYANTNVDVPAMNSGAYRMIHDKSKLAVVDVGGDDRGALALGRFEKALKEEGNFDMLLVINKYRFETQNAQDTLEIMREIEYACGIPFTGIVNDSNLGKETTAKTVLNSLDFANEVSKLTGLPIKFTCVERGLYDELKNKINNLVPIDVIHYGVWC